jgi:hypothetical protein
MWLSGKTELQLRKEIENKLVLLDRDSNFTCLSKEDTCRPATDVLDIICVACYNRSVSMSLIAQRAPMRRVITRHGGVRTRDIDKTWVLESDAVG